MTESSPLPGGFLVPSMLSPPQSSSGSLVAHTSLPHPRSTPLKSGSTKESTFIRFVDQSILQIERRYTLHGNANEASKGIEKGYRNFGEAAQDIERLVDLIWISGSPSLQIPYLLTLASLVAQYLPFLPPAQKPTFRLLEKLDLVFASLLQGRHVETGEVLPGFERGIKVSGTEKVRVKSLVDRTRIVVMDVIGIAGRGDEEETRSQLEETDFEEENEVETEDDVDMDASERDVINVNDFGECEMGVAMIYARTVVELGDTIGGSPIGIITDD